MPRPNVATHSEMPCASPARTLVEACNSAKSNMGKVPRRLTVFAVLHGAGNGILTIARGTVPLAIYGQQNYGQLLGLIGARARIAQAGSPLVFSFTIEYPERLVLIVWAVLCTVASLALLAVRTKDASAD